MSLGEREVKLAEDYHKTPLMNDNKIEQNWTQPSSSFHRGLGILSKSAIIIRG